MRGSGFSCAVVIGIAAAICSGCSTFDGSASQQIAADPDSPAVIRQACVDSGYPTGTVAYDQCARNGTGMDEEKLPAGPSFPKPD